MQTIDPHIERLLDEARGVIAEFKQYIGTPAEPTKRGQVQSRLKELQDDLSRTKRIMQQDMDESRLKQPARPNPLDAEIRQVLRGMPAAEREKLVAAREPSVINALRTAPCWLSGVDPKRLKQLEAEDLEAANKDRWAQQEVDNAAIKELDAIIREGLRKLYERELA
ncbi:MAG TPA: hypothetical protein VKB96_03935 [Gammaproteobacteria bacterium]|nr:hypothetical protein [Gammaproteobacteria bacterium]